MIPEKPLGLDEQGKSVAEFLPVIQKLGLVQALESGQEELTLFLCCPFLLHNHYNGFSQLPPMAPEPPAQNTLFFIQVGRISRLAHAQGLLSSVQIRRTGPGYLATTSSAVSKRTSSVIAWATRTRSKGSLWIPGKWPTAMTCVLVMASSEYPFSTRPRLRIAGSTRKSLRPSPRLNE